MAAVLSLSAAAWCQVRSDMPVTSPPVDRVVPLEVTINGDKLGTWAFVERQGMLYAPQDALDEWRVQLRAGAEPIVLRGVEYWPLSSVPGYSAKANYSTQSVDINFAPEAFTSTKVSKQESRQFAPSPIIPSAFANYELTYSDSSGTSERTRSLGAMLEVGASMGLGVLTSSQVGRNLTGSSMEPSGWTRLETTFTRHFPQENMTLRLGDAATRVGLWGRATYFGGVQLATNYTLIPGFLTQPIPVVSGVSSAPSTVELYVNGVLKQVTQVPTGPFAIDNNAALTGSGEARLVVKDILGREMVITQPFFTSASLLAKGLNDWSAEAGALRRDLGQASSNYGPDFVAGTWRRGLNDNQTLELRGEATPQARSAGIGLITAMPAGTLGRAAWVGSRDDLSNAGSQWLLGIERQWATAYLNLQAQAASRTFRELGFTDKDLPARRQFAFTASQTTATMGSFGIAAAVLSSWDGPGVRTVSLNYSLPIGQASTLAANASRAYGAAGTGTSFGLTLHIPLDRNRQVTTVVQSQGGRVDAYAAAAQTAGIDSDIGWRVLGGHQANQAHAEGGLYYQGRNGNLYADMSSSPGQTSIRTGAAGGFVVAAGDYFVTRRVEQSYAVVEVKDMDDVAVGIGTNMLTRTNAHGMALVPNLGANAPNQIRLNPQDLPVSAEIESIETIVVPAWRSAVKADFPVRSGRAALLRIEFDDGLVAPAGAVIRVRGQKDEFIVARRGESYVTGLETKNKLELEWNGQRCGLEAVLPPLDKNNIARVGPLLCAGVKR
jgi:outer membrane usher protein